MSVQQHSEFAQLLVETALSADRTHEKQFTYRDNVEPLAYFISSTYINYCKV